jgi:cell pole-organizing protein PopZ
MEEILASIRKIISEDQEAAPAARPAPVAVAATPAPAEPAPEEPAEESDVLELTHEVHEEAVPEPQAAAAPEQAAPQTEPEPEPVTASAGSEVPVHEDVAFEDKNEEHEVGSQDIIPDTARQAMSKAFEPYGKPAEAAPTPAAAMPPMDGNQLESVFSRAVMQSFDPVLRDWMNKNSESVVQHMKPIIREWMDQNLPDLIERAVTSEMAAAVRTFTRKP